MLVNGREIPDYIDIGALMAVEQQYRDWAKDPNRKMDIKTATIKIVGDSPLLMSRWSTRERRLPGIEKPAPNPCDTCPYRAGK